MFVFIPLCVLHVNTDTTTINSELTKVEVMIVVAQHSPTFSVDVV